MRQPSRKTALASILFVGALLALAVEAQQPKKVPRIGFLVVPTRSFFANRIESFRQGLQSLGYVEGKNVVIEYRYAEGNLDRLPELAKELVDIKVDVIVTTTASSVLVVKNATRTIPVVFAGIQDPVASGIVDSLARPGGNATGLSIVATELGGKRLELLKETVPRIARVLFIWQGASTVTVNETQAAARALGLQCQSHEVRDSKSVDNALVAATKERAQALLTSPSPIVNTHQARIIEFAAKNRLPPMYAGPELVDAGGLMSYAPSYTDLYRRVAYFVDKILKGAKPADLPIEQPKKVELVINLKTAKQIGLTIPPNVLARADRVIR